MRPTDPSCLTPAEIEALRKVSAAGAGIAGQALSQLTRKEVGLSVPRVSALPLHEVPALLGGPEAAMVALHFRIYGGIRGNILIALPPESAGRIVAAVLPGASGRWTAITEEIPELEQSVLLETGNILAAAYLNAISAFISHSLLPSVPHLACDMAGAVVDYLLVEITRGHDTALVIDTEMRDLSGQVGGHILLLPDPVTLPAVLKSLRERLGIDGAAGA